MSITYKVPKPIGRPFQVGEEVEVCDRDLEPMGVAVVASVGKKIVRLTDGRRFQASNGWYVGHRAWPFPSIRHKKKGGAK